MKKTLDNGNRQKIYNHLKKSETIIQSVKPLIEGDLVDSLGDDGVIIIKIMMDGALSQLNKAKENIEPV
jgi:hypothetical protein